MHAGIIPLFAVLALAGASESRRHMVGEEEEKIRRNPLEAGSGILRKVIGALK